MQNLLSKEIDLIMDDLKLIERRLEIMKSVCNDLNRAPDVVPYDPSTTPVVSLYACPTVPGVLTSINSITSCSEEHT